VKEWRWYGSFDGTLYLDQEALLYPYTKSGPIKACPSRPSIGRAQDADLGYAYNSGYLAPETVVGWPPTEVYFTPVSLGAIQSPAETVAFHDSARLVKGVLQSTPHPCPPSRGGSCFHGRHNEMGTVVWADGHVKATRPLVIDREKLPAAELRPHHLGDIDRDGDPTTDELWDLE
jgi:prepilin-type processing-associated H-X9-DG protein